MSCSSGNCVIGSCVTGYYDVDGLAATGCEELDSTASQSTKESATYLGSFSCNDSGSAQDIEGDIPSDLHTATTSGAKDDFWRIYASGGLCVNDLALTFVVTGSSQADCYQLLVQPDGTDVRSCTPSSTTASCTISAGSGSYDDDTNIYLQVRKTCTADTVTEAVSYQITGHL